MSFVRRITVIVSCNRNHWSTTSRTFKHKATSRSQQKGERLVELSTIIIHASLLPWVSPCTSYSAGRANYFLSTLCANHPCDTTTRQTTRETQKKLRSHREVHPRKWCEKKLRHFIRYDDWTAKFRTFSFFSAF